MNFIFGDGNNKNYGKNWITCDWNNSDINMYFTYGSKFPIQDNSIELIYTSHVIEHMK